MELNRKENEQPSRREWQLIEKVVLTHSEELKRSRRWGIVFKSLTFMYLFAILALALRGGLWPSTEKSVSTGGHTAVVKVHGVIADGADASFESLRRPLMDAFSHPDTKAVVLSINSPGGSPVQAQMVYDLVRQLRETHEETPVYAVIEEIGASGGYFVAAAADEIYASGASLVGSIGVISSGFGFADAMERLGIERRLYTSGENKAFLDAFSPADERETAHWEYVLGDVHQQFITAVKQGRGERLRGDDPRIFNGFMWSGAQAIDLGLTDGINTVRGLAEQIGSPRIYFFETEKDPWRRILDDLGISIGQGAANILLSMGTEPRLTLK